MATTVSMPQLGESVVEGEIGPWLVKEGERVEKNQPLVTILTDKTDTDLPAPEAGVVVRIIAKEGDVVEVGAELCELDASAEESASSSAGDEPKKDVAEGDSSKEEEPSRAAEGSGDGDAPAAAPRSREPAAASPALRKLARERGVDLNEIEGSGDGGRITREDVIGASQGSTKKQEGASAPKPSARPERTPPRPSAGSGERSALRFASGAFRVPAYQSRPGDEVIPFSRRRRIIADHMVYSKLTSPHVVTFAETDLHQTARLRDEHKGALKKEGINLTFLAFVAAATARALREHRAMNARVLEDEYVLLKEINLGIAVETSEGLVVPVVRHADELSVRGLARAIGEVAERARTGTLTPDDLAGKTFTISNPGRKGNLVGGAIISQPNVGILRMGEIKKRVVVIDQDGVDAMAIHPVMYMALSYDHRVVDGVEANGFLYRVHELLESGDLAV